MISHAYEFMCDNCGETAYYIYPNKKNAKEEAGADGWITYKSSLCFCCEACFMKWYLERQMIEDKECE